MRLQQLLTVLAGYRPADVRRALAQALGKTKPRTPAAYGDLYVAVYAQLRLHAHRGGVPTTLESGGAGLASRDELDVQSATATPSRRAQLGADGRSRSAADGVEELWFDTLPAGVPATFRMDHGKHGTYGTLHLDGKLRLREWYTSSEAAERRGWAIRRLLRTGDLHAVLD